MDIKLLKDILRHKKIETTERYIHLTTKSLQEAMQKADQVMQYQVANQNLQITNKNEKRTNNINNINKHYSVANAY